MSTKMTTADDYFDQGDGADAQYHIAGTAGGIGNGANEQLFFDYLVLGAKNTAISTLLMGDVTYFAAASSEYWQTRDTGIYLPTTAVTNIRFMWASGNVAAGEARVIGVP